MALPLKKIQIAAVDDHRDYLAAITRALEAKDILVFSFSSVAEFVRSPKIHLIDCLLLDLEMPEIDGVRCQSALLDTNFAFPVIFCTGSADEDMKMRAQLQGAYCIHPKPIQLDLLVEQIRAACLLTQS